jgi:NAD(P)H-hydrate epimerase
VTLERLPLAGNVPAVTAAQMAEADRITIEQLGIAVEILMEAASRQLAAAARAMLGGRVAGKRIVGLVGSGNNGGDAVGALRHLADWGAGVGVAAAAPADRLHDVTRQELGRLRAVANADDTDDLGADLLIDGLLGYSARGAPRGTVATLAERANASGSPVLAVDLPSGLDPDTGRAAGVAIRARVTVTLALPKRGLLAPAARAFVGELLLADIGIPPRAFARLGIDTTGVFREGDLVRILR